MSFILKNQFFSNSSTQFNQLKINQSRSTARYIDRNQVWGGHHRRFLRPGIKIGFTLVWTALIGACTSVARADMTEKGDIYCSVFCSRDFATLLSRELHLLSRENHLRPYRWLFNIRWFIIIHNNYAKVKFKIFDNRVVVKSMEWKFFSCKLIIHPRVGRYNR